MRVSIDRRRWATIAVTLALAFASGHLMQTVLAPRATDLATRPAAAEISVPDIGFAMPSLRVPPVLPDRTRETFARAEAPRLQNLLRDTRLAGR